MYLMTASLRTTTGPEKPASFPQSDNPINFSDRASEVGRYVVDKIKAIGADFSAKDILGAVFIITWVATAVILGVFCPPALIVLIVATAAAGSFLVTRDKDDTPETLYLNY